jgi:acetolactate synthase I/II/III large subunit
VSRRKDLTMNGAESLIRTAVAAGVEVCFANPGTTEMALVAALDAVDGMRAVLGLFEGVCTGAADGYGRMADRPALTILHLGPGFANGIANLHNARRARSPVVNLIGDHTTWHTAADPPLASDIISLARPVSAWIRRVRSAGKIAADGAEAIAAARKFPGRVSTLIIPADCAWDPSPGPASPVAPEPPPPVSEEAIAEAARMVRTGGGRVALFLGGRALRERGLQAAGRIAAAAGCRLMCETFPARVERGRGMPAVERLPYFPEQAIDALQGLDGIVLAGAPSPVAFFGYPNLPSSLVPKGCAVATLSEPEQDSALALEALAQAIGAPSDAALVASHAPLPKPSGALNAASIGQAIAVTMPEGTIIVDEAATTGLPFFVASADAPRHTYLGLTGGAIGQGLPCATGAALACPERRAIAFEADGSGLYTIQALWTQARESLNVTTLLCNNRSYRILQVELARSGVTEAGPKARSLTSLGNPELGWVGIARGMGVAAVRVESAEALTLELERALCEPGPNFIEMAL